MKIWLWSIGLLAIFGCQKQPERLVNTAHLDDLYENIRLPGGDTVGIIHIYSEAPDYHWVDDSDEGTACVDDAARAAIFYLRDYTMRHNAASLAKARHLISFLLNMQAANGYFYNFIWRDGSINENFQTSRAEPNWWSWRAFWALGESLQHLPQGDPIRQPIELTQQKLLDTLLAQMPAETNFVPVEGLAVPNWLPFGSASDQGAILMLGLLDYYNQHHNADVLLYIRRLAHGLQAMQIQNNGTFPHGAFLSWQNLWHAYGNSQAYALLRAGKELGDSTMIQSALTEIDHFYPEVMKREFMNEFSVAKDSSGVRITNQRTFSQIAYGIRPMVWACMEAYVITGKAQYQTQAKDLAQWLFGENPADARMYDPDTGICFDGIESVEKLNQNSGAESTIEALLTLQAIE